MRTTVATISLVWLVSACEAAVGPEPPPTPSSSTAGKPDQVTGDPAPTTNQDRVLALYLDDTFHDLVIGSRPGEIDQERWLERRDQALSWVQGWLNRAGSEPAVVVWDHRFVERNATAARYDIADAFNDSRSPIVILGYRGWSLLPEISNGRPTGHTEFVREISTNDRTTGDWGAALEKSDYEVLSEMPLAVVAYREWLRQRGWSANEAAERTHELMNCLEEPFLYFDYWVGVTDRTRAIRIGPREGVGVYSASRLFEPDGLNTKDAIVVVGSPDGPFLGGSPENPPTTLAVAWAIDRLLEDGPTCSGR